MCEPANTQRDEHRHRPEQPLLSRLDEAAGVLYALAYSRYLSRRFAGLSCHLCGHERARAVTGDFRITRGPRRGICRLRCYARLVDAEYSVAALGLDGADEPRVHPSTCRAVSRRLFALVAEHEATHQREPGGHGGRPVGTPQGGTCDDR